LVLKGYQPGALGNFLVRWNKPISIPVFLLAAQLLPTFDKRTMALISEILHMHGLQMSVEPSNYSKS
jgi:hypothetical protein